MFTIKQAAARSGLSIPTIRAWERRYGVVHPVRTAAGYRLYDEASIARLIAMRHLVVAGGWRPSQAAERVLAMPDGQASTTPDLPAVESRPGTDRPGAQPVAAFEREIGSFVDAAGRLDVRAMEQVLDEAFAAQRFELAMTGWSSRHSVELAKPGRPGGWTSALNMLRVKRSDVGSRASSMRRVVDVGRTRSSSGFRHPGSMRSAHSHSPLRPGALGSRFSTWVPTCRSRAGFGPSVRPRPRWSCSRSSPSPTSPRPRWSSRRWG